MATMDQAGLRAELKELHRGRGVRRVGVHTWLGPQLRTVAGIPDSAGDEDARSALVRLLRDSTSTFPRDLRYLFLVATGIIVDHPFLEDRLAVAEKALDRSSRVLRRRLRTAEQLLADSLAQSYSHGSGPYEDQGWQWDEHRFELILRADARLTLSRTLRALADHQKYIHESFVIPGRLAAGVNIEFEAVEGLQVLDVDHSSENTWGVTLELPRTLARGQILLTVLRVAIPDARVLNPFLVIAPLRPSRRAVISVDFGTPPAASSSWVIDAAIPSDVTSHSAHGRTVDPRLTPVVTGEFGAPRPGLAYGIGWDWTD